MMKKSWQRKYWQRNSSNLLNDLRNFNEISRKDVTYDNIKSHSKQGFTLSLEDTFFEFKMKYAYVYPCTYPPC